MKKTILLVASILLMVSCGEVVQKPTNKVETNKYPALVKREKTKKTDDNASENSQPVVKKEEPKKQLSEFKTTQIDLSAVPDILELVKGASVITPEVVDLPNDLLWSRNKECKRIFEDNENTLIRSDQWRHYKGHAHEYDLVDKNGFTLKTERFQKNNSPFFCEFNDCVMESDKYLCGNAYDKTLLMNKNDLGTIMDFSENGCIAQDAFLKDDTFLVCKGFTLRVYKASTKALLFSKNMVPTPIDEGKEYLLKILDFDGVNVYVCFASFDEINDNSRLDDYQVPTKIELLKLDLSGNIQILFSKTVLAYCGNIEFALDSGNIYLSSQNYSNNRFLVKINKQIIEKYESISWIDGVGNFSLIPEYAQNTFLINRNVIIDLKSMRPVAKGKDFFYSADDSGVPVVGVGNKVYLFDQTSQRFDKVIQFEKDVKLPEKLGSGPVPVACGNDVFFIDTNDPSQIKRLKTDKIENGICGAFYSQTQNRTYVYTESLTCFGDEKGLEFTVNPTFYWRCAPRNDVKEVEYIKVTIKWFGQNEVDAKIVFNYKGYEKYNKTFVLKPGVNEIDFPILDIWQFDGGKSELVIGDKSHLIEIMYMGCPD